MKKQQASQIEIDVELEGLMDLIDEQIEEYAKRAAELKELAVHYNEVNDEIELERNLNKLASTLSRKVENENLKDMVEDIKDEIDEGFNQARLGTTLGSALGKLNLGKYSFNLKSFNKNISKFYATVSKRNKSVDTMYRFIEVNRKKREKYTNKDVQSVVDKQLDNFRKELKETAPKKAIEK